MRIEPAPSEAEAIGTRPAATAAALPPLEPPGVRCGFQGLRVTPQVADSVKPQIASSGSSVLPTTIAPASRSRRTISESAAAGSVKPSVPWVVSSPATSISSLSAIGTPSSGRSSPPCSRASACSASSSARSARTTRKAFSCGSSRSIRSRQSRTSSRRRDLAGPHHLRLLRARPQMRCVHRRHDEVAILGLPTGSRLGSGSGADSKLRSGRARSSQEGIHQFQSPISFIAAGPGSAGPGSRRARSPPRSRGRAP